MQRKNSTTKIVINLSSGSTGKPLFATGTDIGKDTTVVFNESTQAPAFTGTAAEFLQQIKQKPLFTTERKMVVNGKTIDAKPDDSQISVTITKP